MTRQRRNVPPPSKWLEERPAHWGGGQRVLWHGTPFTAAAEGIAREGLIRPAPERTKYKGWLKPISGRVYLDRTGRNAAIYALRPAEAGFWHEDDYSERELAALDQEPYAYVFAIPPARLIDVEPDEDFLTHMAAATRLQSGRCVWIRDLARAVLTPRQYNLGFDQLRSPWYALAGKKLLAAMTPAERAEILSDGPCASSDTIAHVGPVAQAVGFRAPKMDTIMSLGSAALSIDEISRTGTVWWADGSAEADDIVDRQRQRHLLHQRGTRSVRL